jgi:pyridoxamine 5'-phosphate oxidase
MSEAKKIIETMRADYGLETLDESTLSPDPLHQFEKWMMYAISKNMSEPHAMNLATVNNAGRVSSRIVLLRDFNKNGFSFYTNYNSKKAQELAEGKLCALNFFWQPLQKQVRIEGTVLKLSATESDNYFASRPRESQIGAHASEQSHVLKNREELEQKFKNLTQSFGNKNIPRPSNWGGFIVTPLLFEFWQGRPNRLHDRIQYSLQNDEWKIERLNP